MARTKRTQIGHKLYLTVAEAAERLGVTAGTVKEWANGGALKKREFAVEGMERKPYAFRWEDVERLKERRDRHVEDSETPRWRPPVTWKTRGPATPDEAELPVLERRAAWGEQQAKEPREARQPAAGGRRLGRPPANNPLLRPEDVDRMAERRRQGAIWTEIGAEVGVTAATAAIRVRKQFPSLESEQRGRQKKPWKPRRLGLPESDRGRNGEWRQSRVGLEDVEKMAELRRKGVRWREVAAQAGMKEKLAQYYVRRMFPRLRSEWEATREMAEKALAMRRAGATYPAIGKELGCAAKVISGAFRILMGPWKQTQQEGGRNSGRAWRLAKLFREAAGVSFCEYRFDVNKAVALRREGWDYTSISKAVGASRPTVMNAIKLRMLLDKGQKNKKAKERKADGRAPRWPVDKAIEMLRSGEPAARVAEAMGVGRQTIRLQLKKRGHVINALRGAHFDLLAAKKMVEEGKSIPEVAKAVGTTAGTIYKYALKSGRRKGPSSLIDWLAVKEMRKEGKSVREVAEAIGVSYWTIRDYERRERKGEQPAQPKRPEQRDRLHVPIMLRMHNMLATPEEIGAALHRPSSEIVRKLKQLGCLTPVKPAMKRREPDEENGTRKSEPGWPVDQAISMLRDGVRIGKVAEAIGLRAERITKYLKKLGYGIDWKVGPRFDWIAAKAMLQEGKRSSEVARAMGLSADRVWKLALLEQQRLEQRVPMDVMLMLQLHNMLATPEEIGELLYCEPAVIVEKLKELGVKLHASTRPEGDASRATRMLGAGESIPAVAAACGMTEYAVKVHLRWLLQKGLIPSDPKPELTSVHGKTRG